jgi:hypothetical protein
MSTEYNVTKCDFLHIVTFETSGIVTTFVTPKHYEQAL